MSLKSVAYMESPLNLKEAQNVHNYKHLDLQQANTTQED